MFVDTHCHLTMEPLYSRLDEVLARAAATQVQRVIVPAFDTDSISRMETLGTETGIYAAIGRHPWWVREEITADALALRIHCANAVAVGEIGLDYRIDNPNPPAQQALLQMQLALAHDLNLPVILHCRGAFDDLLRLLAPFHGRLRGVVHAWSKSPELAERFVNQGLHLGFGGTITRPNAKSARNSAARISLDRIVLETDAPSIGLNNVACGNTEPLHIRAIAEELAALRGVTLAEVEEVTTTNALSLFNLK